MIEARIEPPAAALFGYGRVFDADAQDADGKVQRLVRREESEAGLDVGSQQPEA